MGKRKLSLLVQMMSNYNVLSDADRVHFSDFVRSQLQKKAKSATREQGQTASTSRQLQEARQLQEKTGATLQQCKKILVEANGDIDTAEQLLRARKLAPKSVANDVEG